MAHKDMKPFHIGGSAAMFRPRYEYTGDAWGPGALTVEWDSEAPLSEAERRKADEFCRSASHCSQSFAEAQSHLHLRMFEAMSKKAA